MFRKRPRVRITGRRKALDAPSELAYEITPETYSGPWTLPVGTVLQIVSKPKEK